MKFGISVGNGATGGDRLDIDFCLEVAQRADSVGFDSIWVDDRVVQPQQFASVYPYAGSGVYPGRPDADSYEPLVMASALAVVTKQVRIGIAALVTPLRHPAVTSKMLAAADLLSNGRIILGAGTGWLREEFEALGLPGDWFINREAITSEYLQAIKEIWTNTGPCNFAGRWIQFHDVGAFPKPVQKPHPPIYVAGCGKAAMIRASRLGNGVLVLGASPTQLRVYVERLRDICLLDRRDPAELEVCLLSPVRLARDPDMRLDRPLLTGTAAQVTEDLRAYAKAGLQHLIAAPLLGVQADEAAQVTSGLQIMADEILPAFGRAAENGSRP